MMSMQMQGSFWTAFGVRFGSTMSAIDEILDRDSGFTLEELLNHDDVIQECKYMNSGLIEHLSQRDVLEKLIRYVVTIPDKEEKQQRTKYPYVSSELFACEVGPMMDGLFQHEELLDLLFSFLDQKPPLNPANAGYFRKVVVVLIQRKHAQLVKFIQSKKIIDKMVNHIGLYSIMELLIMIGWDDGLGQVNDVQWLYNEGIIPKLVAKLDPNEKEPEVHVNAARALVDVVVKCQPSKPSLLVSHLKSQPIIEQIFKYMFSGSLSSLTNCLSVIIVLVQSNANMRNELQSTMNVSGLRANGSGDAADEEDWNSVSPVIQLLLQHLPQIAPLTAKPLDFTGELKTQYGMLNPPLGETRMKVVELFLVIVRSNYKRLNDELARLKIIPAVLDLFFQYEWNNMLHGLVENIVQAIIEGDSNVLKQTLFLDGAFVERCIDAHKRNQLAMLKSRGFRLGYMGHLLRMCNLIVNCTKQGNNTTKAAIQAAQKWKDWESWVNVGLKEENGISQIVLGGQRPTSPLQQQPDEELYDQQQHSTIMDTSYMANKTAMGGSEEEQSQPQNNYGAHQPTEFEPENGEEEPDGTDFHGTYEDDNDEDEMGDSFNAPRWTDFAQFDDNVNKNEHVASPHVANANANSHPNNVDGDSSDEEEDFDPRAGDKKKGEKKDEQHEGETNHEQAQEGIVDHADQQHTGVQEIAQNEMQIIENGGQEHHGSGGTNILSAHKSDKEEQKENHSGGGAVLVNGGVEIAVNGNVTVPASTSTSANSNEQNTSEWNAF